MKSILKFLLTAFSFAPVASLGAGPVANTAGHNLTGYNDSNSSYMNNQWNTLTNSRTGGNTKVKADYGNCNAIILRCASPKCSGGGCADIETARAIVKGCVATNAACKKHGQDFIDYVAGQMVANATAEMNRQQMQADAASQQTSQQISEMQQQMQQQMMQMQQQNSAQIESLKESLAESQRAAAEAQAKAEQTASQSQQANVVNADTGLAPAEEVAARSGVTADVIQRADISGEILTELQGVNSSLDILKTTMRDAFRYGNCNEVTGDDCSGPKRVAKFKELAMKFFDPIDSLEENLSSAIEKAMAVGVDLTDVYSLMNGSCNRWAEFLCTDRITYIYDEKGKVNMIAPVVSGKMSFVNQLNMPGMEMNDNVVEYGTGERRKNEGYWNDRHQKDKDGNFFSFSYPYDIILSCRNGKSVRGGVVKGGHDCAHGQVIPPEDLTVCRQNKILTDGAEIAEALISPDEGTSGMVKVGCASDGVLNIFGRANRRRKTANLDELEMLIAQDVPKGGFSESIENVKTKIGGYCNNDIESDLENIVRTKNLPVKACCKLDGDECKNDVKVQCDPESDYTTRILPGYALCSVHAYNIGNSQNGEDMDSDDRDKINQAVALKTTLITQQMYKNYITIESIVKRIKIQLEREVTKAKLQVAGGASGNSSSNGGSDNDTDVKFKNCGGLDSEEVLVCLRENYSKYGDVEKKFNTNIKRQLKKDCDAIKVFVSVDDKNEETACGKAGCENATNGKKASECLLGIQRDMNTVNRQNKQDAKQYFIGTNK